MPMVAHTQQEGFGGVHLGRVLSYHDWLKRQAFEAGRAAIPDGCCLISLGGVPRKVPAVCINAVRHPGRCTYTAPYSLDFRTDFDWVRTCPAMATATFWDFWDAP